MRTMDFLGRLFNVRSGEWPRLLLLYGMSLIAFIGLTWLDTIIPAAFLQLIGVQYLPWVFVSSSAFSLISLFVYTGFADRVGNAKLLILILMIGGAGLLLGLGLVKVGLLMVGYMLMYLALNVPLTDLFNVHWATYVNDFYDIRAAKRIIPVLGTTPRVAGIISGLSMPILNRLWSPDTIIILSVATVAGMGILTIAMPRLLREKPTAPAHPAKNSGATMQQGKNESSFRAYGKSLREGFLQVVHSPYLLWMALSMLSVTILMTLLNYRASAIFQAELQTTTAIANFVGVLTGVANLVVFPIQLFLLSRLIARIGVGNTNLVYPMIGLAMAGSLVGMPGLPSAAFATLDRTALRSTFHSPVDNLLYNAIPIRVKARTRAFVSGLLVPIGTILAGLFLLTPLTNTWFLSAAILILALAFTVAALFVRGNYGKALLNLLEQEDFSSLTLQVPSLQAPASLPATDAAALEQLSQKFQTSTSPERSVFLARLMTEIGGEAAVPAICQAARKAPDSQLRASLIEVLVISDVRRGGAREFYYEMLADQAEQVRLAAIAGLEQVDGLHDKHYLEVASGLLEDPDIAVRLRVLPALLSATNESYRTAGSRQLRAFLNVSDAHVRAQAIRVIGQTRATTFLPELVRSLADRADEVRLSAALAAETLAGDELHAGYREMLLAFVIALLYDPVERARAAAVTVLGRLSQDNIPAAPVARGALAASLADPSTQIREQTVEVLARVGRRAIPQVQEQLSDTDPQIRKLATLVLARIEPRKYAPLISGPTLNTNLLAIYRNLGCLQALADCSLLSVSVLERALHERNATLLREIFYLLGAIQDPIAVETIARSLSSPQAVVRANAAEALETFTAAQTTALITPLFEAEIPAEQLRALLKGTWDLAIPSVGSALRLLLSEAGDPWLRTLAAATLSEMKMRGGPLDEVELGELIYLAQVDPDAGVRTEVDPQAVNRTVLLGERILLLQKVPFFQGMSTDQIRELAYACEEKRLTAGTSFYCEGEAGGILYLVVQGQVAIEQGSRTGARARLAIIEAQAYFGESNLFDNIPYANTAIALQDTLVLCLGREPLIELAGRQPDIYLALINVLSQRLREANQQIAELTRSRSRQLHKLFDSLEEFEPQG